MNKNAIIDLINDLQKQINDLRRKVESLDMRTSIIGPVNGGFFDD